MEINKSVSTIILFIITAMVVFLFVVPKYQEGKDLENSLVQKQVAYNEDSAYYAKISELAKTIDSQKNNLEKINASLPSDFSLSPLVYFFQKKGAENGLIVKSVVFSQLSPPSPANNIRDILFTVNVLGNYQGLKGFLASMDRSARLFEVNSISFTAPPAAGAAQETPQQKSQQQIYTFELVIKTHTY